MWYIFFSRSLLLSFIGNLLSISSFWTMASPADILSTSSISSITCGKWVIWEGCCMIKRKYRGQTEIFKKMAYLSERVMWKWLTFFANKSCHVKKELCLQQYFAVGGKEVTKVTASGNISVMNILLGDFIPESIDWWRMCGWKVTPYHLSFNKYTKCIWWNYTSISTMRHLWSFSVIGNACNLLR